MGKLLVCINNMSQQENRGKKPITLLWHIMLDSRVKHPEELGHCIRRKGENLRQDFHQKLLEFFKLCWGSCFPGGLVSDEYNTIILPWLSPNCGILVFVSGGQDKVESDPDKPTYKVSSKLTLEVSRSDDNSYITCAVDHATLTSGNRRSAQALRVLCESNREGVGVWRDAGATNGEPRKWKTQCVVHIFKVLLLFSFLCSVFSFH